MTLLDDNVLIRIEVLSKKESKIVLPESVKESDAVEKKFIIEDFGPKCEGIQKGQKCWLDTFGPKYGIDAEHFLVKRESIYAVE